MRKYITIVGVGERKAGTSKGGRDYDFTPIHFTYDRPKVKGVACASVKVSAEDLGDFVPAVGESVEVVMHEDYKTRAVYIDAIL